ncbi:DUF4239 domain-containing protein [Nocardia terpenica]|uniref:DUF4239 domain-containing protein n=1 Tax=Nocardia terpenica TaxID=455432 RepID=A0A6G9YUF8_9NOCA|nr:DUF4239 domain-containing protein [Nocardia terpenica]QIS16969.1 DUF4239 domain-containing protein [Nocardia terpenica]
MVQELIVAGLGAVVAVIVFVVGARVWPEQWQRGRDETAGDLVLDLVRNLFIAVIAFMVVLFWQQDDDAENHTVVEAKGLVGVYSLAHNLPEPHHRRVQGLVRDYTGRVLEREWGLMRREHRLDTSTQAALTALQDALAAVPAGDPGVADLRFKAFDSLQQVTEARQDRAVDVDRSVPGFLWIALYVGAVLVLASPVVSGLRITRNNVLVIALLGVVIASMLLQFHHLDRPFSGHAVVSRGAFENAMTTFGQIT